MGDPLVVKGVGNEGHNPINVITDASENVIKKVVNHIPVPEQMRFTDDRVKQASGMIFVASIVMIVAILLITHSPTFSTVFYMLFGAAGAVGLVVFVKKSITEYKEEKKEHKADPNKTKKPSLFSSFLTPLRNKQKANTVG